MTHAERIVARMTAREKVGQLFMFRLEGTTAGGDAVELVCKYGVGGFVLFRDNIASAAGTVELTNALKSLNVGRPLPLFVAADQEGGRVQRLPREATDFPAARSVGFTGSASLAGRLGRAMGEELQALGISVDLAPVLDVDTNPRNPVIGDRSFGSDPAIVETVGLAMAHGLQSTGTIIAIKHFPGHGDTDVDSHVDLPVIAHDRTRLDAVEIRPFAAAIRQGADMVMPAHVAYPALDRSGRPATTSPKILTGLLREELGFDGVIITDALAMGAIVRHCAREDALLGAIDAGADILLLPAGRDEQVQALKTVLAAVNDGRIGIERIDQSVRRIAALKLRYRLSERPLPAGMATEVLARPGHREAAAEARSR